MKSHLGNKSRLGVETLEDRTVPSGCQAFGTDHVALLAQTVVPLGYEVVSPIAQSAPGAVATVIAADLDGFCT
ncbi:MAG: hypothetical protein L0Z62_28230 [Gemmataceae bacterium]|nr:hypothetical protein [Gemmataceae bacterium]